jgi:hypothetical protein
MSLFKKDYQEHFDFFAKCSDYIFTKHRMAQTGAMRFASASDILAFRALENIVLAESEDSLNLRLSQIADDFSTLGAKIKRSLRNQYDIPSGMKFNEFRAQNKETEGFDEQRLSIKNEISKSRDFKKLSDALVMPLTNKVIAVAKGLVAAGVQPGQAVAIMSRTRYEWALIDFAIWYAGAVSVPIYETSAPSQIEWILSDADCVALFVENDEHVSRFEQIKSSAPLCRQVFTIDSGAIENLKKLGRDITDDSLETRRKTSGLFDLATIIYTSGTTGKPKGCELLHRGFVELSKNATLELPDVVNSKHTTLLFLPLAHVFARFVSVLAVHGGVKVGHQPDTKTIAAAMQSFKPHFLLAVPRVFEKVYNSAEQRAGLAAGRSDIAHTAADNSVAMVEVAKVDAVILGGGDRGLLELFVGPEIQSLADVRGKAMVVDAPNTASFNKPVALVKPSVASVC